MWASYKPYFHSWMSWWFTYFEDVLGVCQAKEHSCQANKGKHHITKALEKKCFNEMVFCVTVFRWHWFNFASRGKHKSGFWIPGLLSNCYHAMMLCDCCFILDWVCFPRWIFQPAWELGKSHCNQERRKPQRLWRKWWSNSDVVVSADLYYVNLLIWCFDQNVTRRTLWLILNSEHVIFLPGLPYCSFGQWYF